MLDSKMNAEQGNDVEFDLPNFAVPKEEIEVVAVVEDYMTESYVTKPSFELVKCEIDDEVVALDGNMISEEDCEENFEDQSKVFFLKEDDDKNAVDKDIENIFLIDDYRCVLCLQTFPSEKDLNVHISLYNPNEIHHCNYCAQSFHTKRIWSAHIETHLQSKEFICMICLHCCSSTDDLQLHLAVHHPNVLRPPAKPKMAADCSKKRRCRQTYICAVCNATYQLRKTLIRHLQNHNLVCATCGESFVSKERLKYHISAKHNPEQSNVCAHCDHCFCSKAALKRHQSLLEHATSTPYLCHICNKYYSSKSSLNTHSRLHLGQKRFQCAECGKGFMRKDRLDSHQAQLHGAGGGYLCPYCGKRISRRENLKYHLRLHTGEKPFVCTVCSKSFPSQSALKKHTIIHTADALFTCHICERTIARKDNFLVHLRLHIGKKEVC